ncbi:hypothetical protein BMS3Abin09_01044 [bacterium BMS3Abin09]|nr:hypothetical protein BMS3Abin09_01044 [bacterium BMS3Abin09]
MSQGTTEALSLVQVHQAVLEGVHGSDLHIPVKGRINLHAALICHLDTILVFEIFSYIFKKIVRRILFIFRAREIEGLFISLRGLFSGYISFILHPLQNNVLPLFCLIQIDVRRVSAWCLYETADKRCFGKRDVGYGFAEIRPCRHLDTVGPVSEVYFI